MNNPYCEKHSCEMGFKEGDSKTKFNDDGSPKHWKGYFCPTTGCETKEWINDKKSDYKKVYKNPVPIVSDEQYQNLLTANRELYFLIKVVAYKVGLSDRDILDDLARLKEKK